LGPLFSLRLQRWLFLGFESDAAFGDFGFFCLNLFALDREVILPQCALFGVQIAKILAGGGD
jgi:hypothetical protein